MIRRPPRSTHCISSAASDVYKRQIKLCVPVPLTAVRFYFKNTGKNSQSSRGQSFRPCFPGKTNTPTPPTAYFPVLLIFPIQMGGKTLSPGTLAVFSFVFFCFEVKSKLLWSRWWGHCCRVAPPDLPAPESSGPPPSQKAMILIMFWCQNPLREAPGHRWAKKPPF